MIDTGTAFDLLVNSLFAGIPCNEVRRIFMDSVEAAVLQTVAIAVKEEREACAKIAETGMTIPQDAIAFPSNWLHKAIAEAIRKRG